MQQQYKRKIIKYWQVLRPTIKVGVFFLVVVLVIKIFFSLQQFTAVHNLNRKFLDSLLFGNGTTLDKHKGRTNVLLLGIPGGDYGGKDLTDAIILLSIDIEKKDVVELSIPRDIWSDTLKDKINTAFHYGEEKKKGGGLILSKSIVEEVVGQPVHYAWIIDFSGFKKMIDLAGGVEIDVENSFTDNFYPIPGREDDFCGGDPKFACRYEILQFERGLAHMDGEKALKYVRSRQAEGEEGTDFARGKRQQQVLMALKNKFLKPDFFWQNITRIRDFMVAFDEATDTDMKLAEQILFFKSFVKSNDEKTRRLVLTDLLINPPLWQYKGEWVLIPRSGDYDEIHKYISCNLEDLYCPINP